MNVDGLELLLQASLPVQIILFILCVASLTSWVLIFEKYFTLSRSTKTSHELEDRFWQGDKIADLYTELKEKDVSELETSELILVTTYEELKQKRKTDQSIESAERLIRVVVSREEERLSNNLSLLATISSSAPYIGLLGTVIGIINAFQVKNGDDIILLSSVGKANRLKSSDISIIGRATQGVRLMKLEEDIKVVAAAKVDEKVNDD